LAFLVAQWCVTGLTLALAIGLAAYVANTQLLGLVAALVTVLLLFAWMQRRSLRGAAVLLLPVFAVNTLYLFLEAMTLSANLRYSVPYNVDRLLANDRTTSVYAYQLDPTIAWELGIYRSAPSRNAYSAAQLPTQGAPYLLLARDAQLAELSGHLGATVALAQGNWVDHKTGILPRQLNLAKGVEPLETFSLLRVTPK
jgi:hypothetical protein